MHYFVKANPDLCIGCRTCMIGCVVAHEGLRIFEVDPDSYTFNPKLHMVKTAKIISPFKLSISFTTSISKSCVLYTLSINSK